MNDRTQHAYRAKAVGLILLSGLLATWGAIAKPVPALSDASALYEDARARASADDYAGAVIQLKNLLQQTPEHLPARITLGEYLIREGDPQGAEKELRIALARGAEPLAVFPALGNAFLMQREYQKILETIRPKGLGAKAGYEVLVLRGRAHFELGHLAEAGRSFREAHALESQRTEALLGLAQVAQTNGQYADAKRLADQAIMLAPQDPEGWYQKGQVLNASRDAEGALSAYNKALELGPKRMRTRMARAGLYLDLGEFKKAEADAQFVRDANPLDLQASFVLWQAALQLGEEAEAKASIQIVAERLSAIKDSELLNELYLLRIAAILSYAQRDLAKADRYLSRFVELSPNDQNMQRLMGQVKFLLGDAQGAIRVLYPLYQRDPKNVEVLSNLGQAYLQLGNYHEASAMFERAIVITPGNTELAASLALGRVGAGSWDDAISGLEGALQGDEKGRATSLLLTILQLKRDEPDQALKTIQALCARYPDDPTARNLLGVVQASRRDYVAARKTFEETIKLAPDYLPPEYNLAKFSLAEGDIDGARKRLEAVVTRNPRSEAALMLLAEIAIRQQNTQAAADWMEKAVGAAPQAIKAQARLAELHLTLKHSAEALRVATRLVDRNPENALAVETLANVQLALDKRDLASRNFRTAVRYASYDGAQLMRIARQQVALEDYDEARKTLIKATNSSVSREAQAALARLDTRVGEFDAAMVRIKEIQAAESKNPLPDILLGELYLQRKELVPAVTAFETAQSKAPSTQGVLGLVDALTASGDLAKAVTTLETWTTAHSGDIEAKRKLALVYLPVMQLDKAEALHVQLLVQQPDDPVLLSNLARIYQLKKDPRARALAEKAVLNAPQWAVALDTLGWILVTEGETEGGLRYLREAIARQNNPLTRYHLAQALSELGRTDEAKVELSAIISAGKPADLVKDVQRYYDGLADKK